MSIVYLAERVGGGDPVVLKVLREELYENEDLRRRFLRESGYAASLDHPNIVKVLGTGEVDRVPYIAMQYIEGTDLYTLLEEGPLEADVAVAILAQVGAALDAAHALGLLHRDVKPGNVLIAPRGKDRAPRCFLTDFGLSKRTSKDSVSLTRPGDFVGTIAYTAPEQMLGSEPHAAADIYSLGCLLFECLAGQPPFTGREVEMMQAHIESPPPKLSKKGFPPQLDAVIRKALAKEPAERYASCGELVQATAAALGVQAPSAMSLGTGTEADGLLELVVMVGNAAGSSIRIDDELLIGRGEPGEGRLGDDPELSRRHARISRRTEGGLTIEDLGSTNGTFVNGRQVSRREALGPGDEIELGGSKLVVSLAAEQPGVVEPAPEPGAREAAPPGDGDRVALPRLSVRLEVDPASGQGTVQLDEGSQPIGLVYEGGSWRLSR